MLEKEIKIKVKQNENGSINHSIEFDKSLSIFIFMQALGTTQEKISHAIYNKFPKEIKYDTQKLNMFLLEKTMEDLL